jgi:hypothetical protein
MWLHCENRDCLHRARVDLEAIAERYGAELYGRLPKVVCRSAFPPAIWAWCLAIQSAAASSDAKLVTKVG